MDDTEIDKLINEYINAIQKHKDDDSARNATRYIIEVIQKAVTTTEHLYGVDIKHHVVGDDIKRIEDAIKSIV
ncbi:MAG: hypothetical protein QW478_08820 [Candidatus Micrarchaeaceae archaeon]